MTQDQNCIFCKIVAKKIPAKLVHEDDRAIAGPNPELNAIDMLVFSTLSRMVIEVRWVGERYGHRAQPLLDEHRALERRIWDYASVLLSEAQTDELRSSIEAWHRKNPLGRAVPFIHLEDRVRNERDPPRQRVFREHLLVPRHRSAQQPRPGGA